MCGPAVSWDFLVLDVSYVLILVGGAMVLRAKRSSVFTWVGFGALSVTVGAFLLSATWLTGPAMAAASANTAEALLENC